MQELKRRQELARSSGIDGTEMLTPEQVAERIPLLDASAILGGYLRPTDGIAKAVRIVTALARAASERGVTFEGGRGHRVRHPRRARARGSDDRGAIECERVLLCAGI